MEINEHIKYLESKIVDCATYRDAAIKKGNYRLAVLNMKYHFIENLKLGLIQWRLGQSPLHYMQRAFYSLLSDWEMLRSLGVDSGLLRELPLHCSTYVASLLNASHPALDVKEYEDSQMPGLFLGNVLIGGESIENWPQCRDKLPNKKRNALARATFDIYAGLLSGQITAKEGVEKGEILYVRRKNDPYYNDSPSIFGGTELNDRFVDFRLGAILKHIGSTVPSIHAWRW